jgi:hydroxymethylbilane synthase
MKIGTRGSDLALWQARLVRALLQEKVSLETELVIIKTQGDLDQTATFDKMEGKGFFTKEIEAALLNKSVDLAVHSLKDLQTTMPPGLALGALFHRADRRDMILIRPEAVDDSRLLHLREDAKVGTTSARRAAQLIHLRPDLNVIPLRGNVPTRLRKLREGQYDAILVASAGVDRLELPLDGLVSHRLPEGLFVPAPGQGALAIQIRDKDAHAALAASTLNETEVRDTVWLEREILKQLEGGCQLPLGTCADLTEHGFRLRSFLGGEEGVPPKQIVVCGKSRELVADNTVNFLRGQLVLKLDSGRRARVWITREPDRAAEFVNACDPNRVDVAALPVFCAVDAGDDDSKKQAVTGLESYDWIIFTSQITVLQFATLMAKHQAQFTARTRLAAIGAKTARSMKEQGWKADFVSDVADAVSLGEAFMAHLADSSKADDKSHPRILFPCSAKASHELESAAEKSGFALEQLVCYDTVAHPDLKQTIAAQLQADIVVFTSPSAAEFLLAENNLTHETVVVSIGPATSEYLLAHGFPLVWEAADRSMEGLAEVIHGLIAH